MWEKGGVNVGDSHIMLESWYAWNVPLEFILKDDIANIVFNRFYLPFYSGDIVSVVMRYDRYTNDVRTIQNRCSYDVRSAICGVR